MLGWAKIIFPVVVGGFLVLSGVAQADSNSQGNAVTQAEADGVVLLTVTLTGDQGGAEQRDTRHFTLAELRALGEVTFETETIWTSGLQQFTGVSLAVLIAQFAPVGGIVQARAINDYMVEIPLSDAVEDGPIIAYERNGKTMSLRTKGPLWIVYPYDSNPAYKTEAVYSRSIWQLDSLSIATLAD